MTKRLVNTFDAAKGFLVTPSGRTLFLLRSSAFEGQDGPHWDIPGGIIRPGASSLQGLSQEIREETGLVVPPFGQFLTHQAIELDFLPQNVASDVPDLVRYPDGGMRVDRRSFIVPVRYTSAVTLGDEHQTAAWTTLPYALENFNMGRYLRKEVEAAQTALAQV